MVVFALPFLRNPDSSESAPEAIKPSAAREATPTNQENASRIPNPDSASKAIASKPADQEKAPFSPPPVPDQAQVDFHQTFAKDLDARLHDQTSGQYGGLFQRLRLDSGLQDKVIEVLTEPQRRIEEQAFAAAQAGAFPAPPSMEAERALEAQQDQELRSLLGESNFAVFNEYRATLPDHNAVDSMNQQGANLDENQSQRLFQVLSEARQQIVNQSGLRTQNLDSMPPDQGMALIQQQQAQFQQAVRDRTQGFLRPEQSAVLQNILAQQVPGGRPSKPR